MPDNITHSPTSGWGSVTPARWTCSSTIQSLMRRVLLLSDLTLSISSRPTVTSKKLPAKLSRGNIPKMCLNSLLLCRPPNLHLFHLCLLWPYQSSLAGTTILPSGHSNPSSHTKNHPTNTNSSQLSFICTEKPLAPLDQRSRSKSVIKMALSSLSSTV